MWKRPIRWLVRIVMRNARLRALVLASIHQESAPASPPGSQPAGAFVDRHGVGHELDLSLRDRLKPSWRTMLDPVAASHPPTDDALATRASGVKNAVAEASALVAATTGRQLEGRSLEIGCYDGAAAFELAKRPGTEVIASDLAEYYIIQRPGEPPTAAIEAQQVALATLRERMRLISRAAPGSVEFVEDDVTVSKLPEGTFDGILSYEVLEHVRDPKGAFAAMYRLLKPGGIAYHDYNPFFSLIGGHSLCTLDFPWGHVRLDGADFERYCRELRPEHLAQTMRFYEKNLNRMTLRDLEEAITQAGLELVTLLPWFDRSLATQVSADVLEEVQRNYPSATLDDLLATFVVVVVRRPR